MAAEPVQPRLAGKYRGQIARIVGRGPSLLRFTASDFGSGPVITINHSILQVRALGVRNPLYSMQMDDCLVQPVEPETLLLSASYSARCFEDYPRRMLFDVRDFGRPESNMSTPIAVHIAAVMGVSGLVMLGHDAFTRGDASVVDVNGELTDEHRSFPGYVQGAEQADAIAKEAGIAIRWV